MALAPVTAQLSFGSLQEQLVALRAAVRVTSYVIDEGLSQPYAIDVVLHIAVPQHTNDAPLRLPRTWLGQPASLFLCRPGVASRQWLGVVGSCTVLQSAAGHGVSLCLTLVPRLQLLAHDVASEVFIGHSVLELLRRIVADTLGPNGSLELRLLDPEPLHAPMETNFRFQESRLGHLHRLLRAFGLGYWLGCRAGVHGEPQPVMVVFDNPSALLPWHEPRTVEVAMGEGGALASETLGAFSRSEALGPQSVSVVALDATQLGPQDAEAQTLSGAPPGFFGTHRVAASDLRRNLSGSAFTQSLHQHRANTLARDLTGQAVAGTQGSGNTLSVSPGQELRLRGQEGLWMVTAMRHTGGAGPEEASYSCCFDVAPIDTQRGVVHWQGAALLAPVQPMGLHSATVCGFGGAKDGPAEVDDAGRVLVVLKGMAHTVPEDTAMVPAFPARVGQFWAGHNVGAFFWPRPGMEVLVGFVGAEGSEPIILGSTYNAQNQAPHPFVMAERSGIKTSPGGNELSFFDAPGREELRVSALRTLMVESKELMSTQVGFKSLLRKFCAQSNKVANLCGVANIGPIPGVPKEAERLLFLLVDESVALSQNYLSGRPIDGPSLKKIHKKCTDIEAATEPLLQQAPKGVRRAVKQMQRLGHTLISAISQGLGFTETRTVSTTKIFGNAETDISNSCRTKIGHNLDLVVGKKLNFRAAALRGKCKEDIALRQHRYGFERPSTLALTPNLSALEGSVVHLGAHEKITLVQRGCTIVLDNGEITLKAPKIAIQGGSIAISGSQGVTIKSPNTKIS